MHGNNRYGLQCLTNLDQLPPTGAVIFSAPLKIRSGSGSPARPGNGGMTNPGACGAADRQSRLRAPPLAASQD